MKIKGLFFCIFFCLSTVVVYSQEKDTCHKIIRYLVDKKGIETGIVDTTGHCMKPCKGSFTAPIDKFLLGKRETYYEACTGKWMKIEYYFLGIRTRVRINPAFEHIRWD